MTAPHYPVMLPQVLEATQPGPGVHVVDGTFGAGGYSRAFLDAGAKVTAFDRDPSARQFAEPLLGQSNFEFVQARFSELSERMAGVRIDAVVLDLGVSSMQLDQAERGFSFMRDGPLDMRMSGQGPSAAELVNQSEAAELARILYVYGEERQSRRIAAAIVRRRAEQPFDTTIDLADLVERALGGRRGAKVHPATRTFQALRIAVNEELAELEAGLHAAERSLAEGGRLVVVTFHSLEDRIVKSFLGLRSGRAPGVSRHLPEAPVGPSPSFALQGKGQIGPSAIELHENPRSRSARLRSAIRTSAPAWEEAA
jgi:16S rRNA (cytosine1402-N4)-methyltransferase